MQIRKPLKKNKCEKYAYGTLLTCFYCGSEFKLTKDSMVDKKKRFICSTCIKKGG